MVNDAGPKMPQPGMPEKLDEAGPRGEGVRDLDLYGVSGSSGKKQSVRGRPRKVRPEAREAPEASPDGAGKSSETENFRLKLDWETCTIERGENALQQLRDEITYGAKVLQNRLVLGTDAVVLCSNPACKKPIRNGQWLARHTFKRRDTGLDYTVTSCSQRCHIINMKDIQRPVGTHRTEGGMVLG